MFGITFDFNTQSPKYQSSLYDDMKHILHNFGFNWREGSVYVADIELNVLYKTIEAVKKNDDIREVLSKISVFEMPSSQNGSNFTDVIKNTNFFTINKKTRKKKN